MDEIRKKRGQIARLIETLAQVEHGGTLQLPSLQFESPVRSRSSRRLRTKKPAPDYDWELGPNEEAEPSIAAGAFYGERSRAERLRRRQTSREMVSSQQVGTSAQLELEVSQVSKSSPIFYSPHFQIYTSNLPENK